MDSETSDAEPQHGGSIPHSGSRARKRARTPLHQMLLAQQSNILTHDQRLLATFDHTIHLFLTYPWTRVPIMPSDAQAYREYETQLRGIVNMPHQEQEFLKLRQLTAARHPNLGYFASLNLATWNGISSYANAICLGLKGLASEASAVFRISLESFMHAYLLCQNPMDGWAYLSPDSKSWYRLAHSRTQEWLHPRHPTALGIFETVYARNWSIIRGDGHASWLKGVSVFLDGPRITDRFEMQFALGRSDTEDAAKRTCKYACAVLSQVYALLDFHPAMHSHRVQWVIDLDKSFDALVARAGFTQDNILAILR